MKSIVGVILLIVALSSCNDSDKKVVSNNINTNLKIDVVYMNGDHEILECILKGDTAFTYLGQEGCLISNYCQKSDMVDGSYNYDSQTISCGVRRFKVLSVTKSISIP